MPSTPKVIARVRGGLGNQLFCYAAARRLAIVNNAELVLDDQTAFRRYRKYDRHYELDHFLLPARKATPAERLDPLERYRRTLLKWNSRGKPYGERTYLEQEGPDFDERLLTKKVRTTLYLDGNWQSEGYFKDVEKTLREDLQILPPEDDLNLRLAGEIGGRNAVSVHIRWFDSPGKEGIHNTSAGYYQRAIELMDNRVRSPHYFVFSDFPEAARSKISLPEGRTTFVSHNQGETAYADLWLMSQCRHFINANSTFSWWGAWLGGNREKIVVCPGAELRGEETLWNFKGHVPGDWIQL